MSDKSNILLTAYGLNDERAGLVQAVLHARGLAPAQSDVAAINTWLGSLETTEVDALVNALIKLQTVSFDLEVSKAAEGQRLVYSPNLGLRSAAIDAFGNINLTEHHIRALMAEANQNMLTFARLVDQSLLAPWDAEFEVIRERAMSQAVVSARSSVA